MGAAGHPWHAMAAEEVLRALETRPHGLTSAEAARRLRLYGPNELEQERPTPAWALVLRQLRGPLIGILLVAVVVTLLLGEYLDAGVIAAALALNTVIGFTQERQAEQAVRALRRLASPTARVLRDGRDVVIPSRELVPGDVVLLESGVRVPADLRLVAATALAVDESLLTGESVPVRKATDPAPANAPLADRSCMAYAGTIVTAGRGRGIVVATGKSTEVGAIAEAVRGAERGETPLQERLQVFSRVILAVVIVGAAVTFALGLATGESASHMFTTAVGLAVAVVPEGLPVVFTIALALGVRRMARRNAIVRRLPAVETLGSTTVIATDKTGTLTENRMRVVAIWTPGVGRHEMPELRGAPSAEEPQLPAALRLTLMAGVLTNEASVRFSETGYEAAGDPTEVALLLSAAAFGLDPELLRESWGVEAEIPFEPDRQYSAALRRAGHERLLVVKGAPETVLSMSSSQLVGDDEHPLEPEGILAAAHELAADGLRVLAMAVRRFPEGQSVDIALEGEGALSGLTFVGLQAMEDPPRAGVAEAIEGCRRAGIRVVMVTGDHRTTAVAIARRLGIGGPEPAALTGAELADMDDEELDRAVRTVSVFARVAPEQKLRIVQALKRQGETVAVTGDGVNDAPALRAADIGIAMGRSGTDVAREAADMVLSDDNFVTIFHAVREGRVTFDNLRKATFFLVSTGAASLVVLPAALALGWPVPLVAAQLVWLNLVTNGIQDVALAFEPGDPDVLDRPPRRRREPLIPWLLWERTALVGLVIAVGTLALFRYEFDRSDGDLTRAQTVALTTLVLFQVFHVGNSRSEWASIFRKSPLSNPVLFVGTAVAVSVHIAALYAPPTQYVLRVAPVGWETWLLMVSVATSIIVVSEAHKLLRGRRVRTKR